MVMLHPCKDPPPDLQFASGQPFGGERPARLAVGVPVLPGAACLSAAQGWGWLQAAPALLTLPGSVVT